MLLTPREVADRLSVSVRTVYLWIEQGRLPAVKLSERVTRVPEDAVEAFLAEATMPATTGSLAAEEAALYCPTCGGHLRSEVLDRRTPSDRLSALVREHRDEIIRIAVRNRASNVRLFGSIARGDAREDSDIDLLVDLEPKASLFDLGGLNYELEELLGRRVDVIDAAGLKERIRERVLDEAVSL